MDIKIEITKKISAVKQYIHKSGHEKTIFAGGLFFLGFLVALALSGGSTESSYKADILSSRSASENIPKDDKNINNTTFPEEETSVKEVIPDEEIIPEWTKTVQEKPKPRHIGLSDRMTDEEIAATFAGLWAPEPTEEDISPPKSKPDEVKKEKSYDLAEEITEVKSISATKKKEINKEEIKKKTKVTSPLPKKITHPPVSTHTTTTPKKNTTAQKIASPTPAPQNKKQKEYKNGTYTAIGSYKTTEGIHESISVRTTLESGIIKNIVVAPLSNDAHERQMQATFAKDVSAYVIEEHIDNVPVFSAVNGGSFVPKGFERAIASIKAQAK